MNIRLSFLAALGLILASCGSSEKKPEDRKHENLKRDYHVVEASSEYRPGWIENAEIWAGENDLETKKSTFFSFETEPKVNRRVACDLAKANARADIAGEITTFIDKQLAVSTEGNASVDENNPNPEGLKEYVESTLAEKVQALVHGAKIKRNYWEKRKYKKELGARRNFTGFTCGVLVSMDKSRLKDAIERAVNFVANSTDDPSTKENVKRALKDANENFQKARAGQL